MLLPESKDNTTSIVYKYSNIVYNTTSIVQCKKSQTSCGMNYTRNSQLKYPGAVDSTQPQTHNYVALLTMVVCCINRSLGALEVRSWAEPSGLLTGLFFNC